MLFPHGVPSRATSRSSIQHNNNHPLFVSSYSLIIVATAVFSFFLGTLVSLYAGIDCSSTTTNRHISDVVIQNQHGVQLDEVIQQQEIDRLVTERVKEIERKLKTETICQAGSDSSSSSYSSEQLFPRDDVGHFAYDMARIPKEQFVQYIDPGVPIDPPKTGAQSVLLIYGRRDTLPNDKSAFVGAAAAPNPRLDMPQAIENCEIVHLLLTDHLGNRKQCLAVMPQYGSYHVQNWMRVDDKGMPDKSQTLKLLSRGHQTNGQRQFDPPDLRCAKKNWDMLQHYLSSLDQVTQELDAKLKKIAINNAAIVMVCNLGQAELLMNFVCSCRARGLDISNVIVFTTDQETTDLAESLGLTAFFDKRNFGSIPAGAAQRYGDRKFTAMMMAKVICVQLVSMLGYDFLFQDVDVVWYKNPLAYFEGESFKQYDIAFQDDGARTARYTPYSANSGFYFVRHNERTRHFLTSLLMSGDLVLSTKSHQQALIALLSEHVSLYGLRVKVLSRDMEEFPGGYHFNQRSGKYMKSLFAGEVHPYIFHMSWTLNKDNKLLYFRQMGEWYVQDKCIAKKRDEIIDGVGADGKDLRPTCCSAAPLISCHYRDKPSKIPCKDSPPIDKGRKSFW